MMTQWRGIASLVAAETYRTFVEVRRAPAEFVIGNLILVALVLWLNSEGNPLGPKMAEPAQRASFAIQAMLLFGICGSLPRELLLDVQRGALARLLLAASGFTQVMFARLLVSTGYSIVCVSLLSALVLRDPRLFVDAWSHSLASLIAIVLHATGLTFAFVAVALATKSERVTQAVAFLVLTILLLVPFERILGQSALALPVVGVMTVARDTAGPSGIAGWSILFSGFVWMAAGVVTLRTTVSSLKRSGKLLLKEA